MLSRRNPPPDGRGATGAEQEGYEDNQKKASVSIFNFCIREHTKGELK
jgi:hypothetical protein